MLVLRIREPNLQRSFKTPLIWLVAPLGAISAFILMYALPWPTWERLIIWFAIGMEVYFGYAIYHAKLSSGTPAGETGWSRALKIVGVTWIVLGTLGSLIWCFRYRETYLPGAVGWLYGVAGLLVSWSFGTVLNVIAHLSDHHRAPRA